MVLGAGRGLVGVVTVPPAERRNGAGAIWLNSGIVPRAGIHRLHVRAARALGELGYTTLRLDFSGIGDSDPALDRRPFLERGVDEAREAVAWLGQARGCTEFLLGGLCSGALFAFRAASSEPRVTTLALLNPTGHLHGDDPELGRRLYERARGRHLRRLLTRSSFRGKLLRRTLARDVEPGPLLAAAGRAIRSTARAARAARNDCPEGSMAELRSLLDRGVRVLELHAEGDEGLDYAEIFGGRELGRLAALPGMTVRVVAGANHTFAMGWCQDEALDALVDWAGDSEGP